MEINKSKKTKIKKHNQFNALKNMKQINEKKQLTHLVFPKIWNFCDLATKEK